MDLRTRLILKPILGGVLLGLFIMLLVYPIYKSLPESLLVSLGTGLAFGSFLLLTNLIYLKRMERKYGKSSELLKCYHTREIEIDIPYDEAFDLCLKAVKSLKCNIREANRNLGKIMAIKPTKVPLDWLFNQDLITVELQKLDGRTRIKISSQLYPYPTTEYYIDYGSNLENVEKIVDFLKSSLKSTRR